MSATDTEALPVFPFSETVPVGNGAIPPEVATGSIEIVVSNAGVKVSEQVLVVDPDVAVIVAVKFALTPAVATLKLADMAPTGIVTELGTLTLALDELSLTTIPPAGAVPFKVTNPPLAEFPPTMELGVTLTLDRDAGFTVRTVETDLLFKVPVIVTDLTAVTPRVDTVKVALDDPAAIVTLAGTVAANGFELSRLTTVPAGPASPLIEIVPVTVVADPPTTAVGFTEIPETEDGSRVKTQVLIVEP